MQTITVYDHARTGFRVVAGAHKAHKGSATARVSVYSHEDATTAATLAYNMERNAAVRAQILRICPTLDVGANACAIVGDGGHYLDQLPTEKPADESARALTAALGEAPEHSLECATCGHRFNERAFYSSAHSSMCANPQEV